MARAATKPGPAAQGPASKPASAAKATKAKASKASSNGAGRNGKRAVGGAKRAGRASKGAGGAAKRAGGAAKRAGGAAKRASGGSNSGAGVVGEAAQSLTKAVRPGKLTTRIAGFAARKGMKMASRAALRTATHVLQLAADKGAELSKTAVDSGMSKRLPIQVSVDVAVPLEVAWDEWLGSGFLTEGVHRVRDVERDGSYMTGVVGPRDTEWEAEIVDEREHESFAWRSTVGSDCAGLATFHRLSERLTRIELDLDVLPTNPAEAFAFTTHIAHHRAEADLRRFKARVEFINPDVYEDVTSRNGDAPDQERET